MPKQVPIYFLAGFLEAGKTSMVKDLLEDPEFTVDEKTAYIRCEEGELELPPELLEKTRTKLYTINEKKELTYGFMARLNKADAPDRVILEYNGTWPVGDFLQLELPAGWGIAQIIVPVNAETFDLYINNMRQMMVEQLQFADLVLFNRCTDQTPVKNYWRNMKMINRAAMTLFEKAGGEMIEISSEDMLPFDLAQPVLEIADDDFGIWYVDAMDNPERYDGKVVHFTGMVYHDKTFPAGYFVPGRQVMTCCADDIRFTGYLCKSQMADRLKDNTWVDVTAKVTVRNLPMYGGPGPVLVAQKLEPGRKPDADYVYLY